MAQVTWLQDIRELGLAKQWLHLLQLMDFPTFATAAATRCANSAAIQMPWERLLLLLVKESATTVDGNLCMLPIFLTLPVQVQARLLHLLLNQLERICSTSVVEFVCKIIAQESVLHWTKFLLMEVGSKLLRNATIIDKNVPKLHNPDIEHSQSLQRLRELVFSHVSSVKADNFHNKNEGTLIQSNMYEFSNCNLLSDVLKKVRKGSGNNTNMLDQGTYTNRGGNYQPPIRSNGLSLTQNLPDGVVNVTVIESDLSSDDDIMMSSQPILEDNPELSKASVFKGQKHLINEDSGVYSLSKRVKSFVGETEYDKGKEDGININIENKNDNHKLNKCVNENTNVNTVEIPEETEYAEIGDVSASYSNCDLPYDDQLHFSSFWEKFSSESSSDGGQFIVLWKLFQNYNIKQIEAACHLLGFENLSDERLVTFCDEAPWKSLSFQSSLVIIETLFCKKLGSFSGQLPHTLVTAARAVGHSQPQALVEVLVELMQAGTGVSLCQLLVALCDGSLTTELAGFLVSQLVQRPPDTVSVVTVMQAMVARRPDLCPDSLDKCLLLLATANCESPACPKVGKLLLTFTNKFGKKLSTDQSHKLSVIAADHISSLRKPLAAVLKKITSSS